MTCLYKWPPCTDIFFLSCSGFLQFGLIQMVLITANTVSSGAVRHKRKKEKKKDKKILKASPPFYFSMHRNHTVHVLDASSAFNPCTGFQGFISVNVNTGQLSFLPSGKTAKSPFKQWPPAAHHLSLHFSRSPSLRL